MLHTASAAPMAYASFPTWLGVDHNDLCTSRVHPLPPTHGTCDYYYALLFICILPYSPEPTLTADNVVGVLENVAVERRKEVWSRGDIVLLPQLEEIYQKYSTEEQRIHACADIYVNCCPHSSWTRLCGGLYRQNEMTAARKAKTFIPQTGEQ